ncbi:hypothetical protein QZH41_004288 [Actinostola sp. cb2023]|nr:hypothetical protein QZH41_004288 [Actinostola sp. cb2023]
MPKQIAVQQKSSKRHSEHRKTKRNLCSQGSRFRLSGKTYGKQLNEKLIEMVEKIAKLLNKCNSEFIRYSKVHPFTVLFDYHVDPALYMKVIGWVEIACGLILLAGPKPLKEKEKTKGD